MPHTVPVTIEVAGVPQVAGLLAELARLREAQRGILAMYQERCDCLKQIEEGGVHADDEGRTRTEHEVDVLHLAVQFFGASPDGEIRDEDEAGCE